MKTSNKYKFLLGFGYILILSVFLYFIFSNFSFQEIGNYNFIKDNREFFVKLKEKNVLILATIFIFFTIIWVLLLGFGSPICIVGGFAFCRCACGRVPRCAAADKQLLEVSIIKHYLLIRKLS